MGKFKEALIPEASFRNLSAYKSALLETRLRFCRRVFARSNADSELLLVTQRSGNQMKRTLNWWDLIWMSIGAVVGAGIFVVTGSQAKYAAGPAIVLSYAVAGFSSMLSVFCYTEFAIEVPVAGGSFAYLRVELGDFVAYIAAGNIVLDYVVSSASVARAWTSYFAALINKHPDDLRIQTNMAEGYNKLDVIAVGVLWLTGLVSIVSVRATSTLNWISSLVSTGIILFIIGGGFANADPVNFSPFLPYGTRGVFSAAAVVYFAYLGFDTVATLAEDTKNPARDIPIGLLGSMSLVTVLYCLMAVSLCLMQSYQDIDSQVPFSYAFITVAGWNWAQYVVALGALKGLTTVLLVGNTTQARYIAHIARTHMLPVWFAQVDSKTQTPIRATVIMLIMTSVVALFTDLDVLSKLLSISTLTIFTLVAVALIVRRYYHSNETSGQTLFRVISLILLIIGSSIGLALYWRLSDGWYGHLIFGGIWVLATGVLWLFFPIMRKPKVWGVPLVPWIPSASIGVNIFLMGSIDRDSFIRFGIWTAIIVVYYLFLGLHASYDAAVELQLQEQPHTLWDFFSAPSPNCVITRSPKPKMLFVKSPKHGDDAVEELEDDYAAQLSAPTSPINLIPT
ncbi:hypothetical protein R1flu_012965 [Riccia fluitans]|uniref:Cationic amino acid transporter C-terminal domain-containing protein n=1 Tax=Riccia fluitans TaxID=41844 RepID=A0ABD1ZDD0_9MARC